MSSLYEIDPTDPHFDVADDEDLQNENTENIEYTVEELLISCVQARPPIWDSSLPLTERSKTIRDAMWLEIYREFGEQDQYKIEFLMKRWRNLRDTYVRVKGESEVYTPTGSAGKKKKKKWPYFDSMVFLNETLSYRATTSQFATPPLASPSTSTTTSNSEEAKAATKKRKVECRPNTAENAIVEALGRINTPAPPVLHVAINPICQRMSDILMAMPLRQRTALEIELLQLTYERAKEFL